MTIQYFVIIMISVIYFDRIVVFASKYLTTKNANVPNERISAAHCFLQHSLT